MDELEIVEINKDISEQTVIDSLNELLKNSKNQVKKLKRKYIKNAVIQKASLMVYAGYNGSGIISTLISICSMLTIIGCVGTMHIMPATTQTVYNILDYANKAGTASAYYTGIVIGSKEKESRMMILKKMEKFAVDSITKKARSKRAYQKARTKYERLLSEKEMNNAD